MGPHRWLRSPRNLQDRFEPWSILPDHNKLLRGPSGPLSWLHSFLPWLAEDCYRRVGRLDPSRYLNNNWNLLIKATNGGRVEPDKTGTRKDLRRGRNSLLATSHRDSTGLLDLRGRRCCRDALLCVHPSTWYR